MPGMSYRSRRTVRRPIKLPALLSGASGTRIAMTHTLDVSEGGAKLRLDPAVQLPQVSRGVAMGDLFNEGVVDIVVENLQGNPLVLRPKGVTNHWIGFELQGVQSNRLALNAEVRVTVGNLVQTDEVRSGGSYLSQHDLRLHFGLGAADHVEKVEIRWPSGNTETLTNLAANHLYSVQEGKGVVPADQIRPKPGKHP